MIKNFLLLTGPDDFRLREKVKLYKKAFPQKYPDGEIQTFESEDGLRELENAVLTPNLFGGRRLIFTENFWKKETFEQAEKSNFFDRLSETGDMCTLISIEPKLDKRQKSTKFITQTATVKFFDLLDDNQTVDWCLKYAEKQNGKLVMKDAQFLVKRCGHNLWNLAREIEKLSLCDDGIITQERIKEMTLPHPETVIWDFLESISKKNLVGALTGFHLLLQAKTSVHEILPMLFREVRIHAQIRAGLDQNLSQKSLASATKLHPFVIQKTLPLSKKFSLSQIERMYDMLFEIDKKMKTGGIASSAGDTSELELAIEKFIVDVCR